SAGETLSFAVEVEEVGAGDLRDRVIAVGRCGVVLRRGSSVVSILGGTSGVYVARDVARLQPSQQSARKVEVRLVDQLAISLKRVSAVGHAIEHSARLYLIEQTIKIRIY